jgi:predicted alpha/beta-fold hydrolase
VQQGLIDDFWPLPFLGNPHVQTLLGNMWNGLIGCLPCLERQVVLPDGDRLVVHDSQPRIGRSLSRTAVLIHGLAGSHESGPVQRLARVLLNFGIRVALLDLRGAGRGAALARRGYNGGCSDDVRAALAEIHRWNPASSLCLIGFSLGGNIALKLAGEAADQPIPGLERVAAVAPPIDLERCAALLALPRNRPYEQHFVRLLIGQVQRQRRYFPDLRRVRFPPGTTLRLFDDLYTAPQGGFTDALD